MKRKTIVSTSGAAILLVGALAAVPLARAGTPNCFGEEATRTVGSGASGDVYGTQGDDVIVGTIGREAPVVVHGRDGNDRICVNSPGPLLKLEGGEGGDKMRGNRASFEGGPGGDRIIDWIGSGYAEGGLGNDRITDTGGSGDYFYGQSGDDYLDVSPHRGYAFGGPGTDTCVGNPFKTEGCENP
jgi:Ca2+-binding RTX toxin-like protein